MTMGRRRLFPAAEYEAWRTLLIEPFPVVVVVISVFQGACQTDSARRLQARLGTLSLENAQLVLDELAGRMDTTHVRNPMGYCATLIVRIQRGDFTPELGIRVAEQRALERPREAMIRDEARASSTAADPVVSTLPEAIRSSLERMRHKALSALTDDQPSAVFSSNSGEDERSE